LNGSTGCDTRPSISGNEHSLVTLPNHIRISDNTIIMTPSLKTLAFALCLGTLPILLGPTGCASQRTQTTDQHVADSRLAEQVREALAASADYKYDEVTVAAQHGVIQLNGSVNTRGQKVAAGRIASKVVGVKDIVNNLTVRERATQPWRALCQR
jgi:hypothetical protein